MRKIFVYIGIFSFIFVAISTVSAQTRTEETRTTTDSTGKSITEKIITIAKSEDIRQLNNMIIINPIKFLLFYNLSYYRKVSPLADIGVGFQIPSISDIRGWGINAEVRLHPSLRAPHGFYFAPNFSFNSFSNSYTTTEYDPQGNYTIVNKTSTASASSIGGLVGWQWFPGDEFAIGLGLGVDYYFLSAGEKNSSSNPYGSYEGTAPALRFDIGYAW